MSEKRRNVFSGQQKAKVALEQIEQIGVRSIEDARHSDVIKGIGKFYADWAGHDGEQYIMLMADEPQS